MSPQLLPTTVDLLDLSGDANQLDKIYHIRSICESICEYFLNEKGTIRMCSREIGWSKSTIYNYIHSYIREYYSEEYAQIVKILNYNRRNRSKPRKYWSREKIW